MILLGFLLFPVALTVGIHTHIDKRNIPVENNRTSNSRYLKSITAPTNLDVMDLSKLGLVAIDQDVFDNYTNLKFLNLANNSLKYLPELVFAKLRNLKYLNIANNYLDSGHFYANLNRLRKLIISNNPVKYFKRGHFFGLGICTTIITEGVPFEYITPVMFENPSTVFSRLPKNEANHRVYNDNTKIPHNKFIRNSKYIADQGYNFSAKVCIQNGRLMLLVDTNNNNTEYNCSVVNTDSGRLRLNKMNISRINSGWCRLQLREFQYSLSLEHNQINQMPRELMNNLTCKIVEVSLRGNNIQSLKRGVIENVNPIKLLDLSKNNISDIEDGAFKKLNLTGSLLLDHNQLTSTKFLITLPWNIRGVSLVNNSISNISAGNFINFTSLSTLDLSWNNIRVVEATCLQGLSSLRKLYLSHNKLRNIKPGFLQDLNNLNTVSLNDNDITSLATGVFSGLKNLRFINLNSNKLTTIARNVFSDMSHSLQTLYLNHNRIERLRPNTFVNVPKYKLYLQGNNISEISKESINLPNLQHLDLSFNSLMLIDGDMFNGLGNLTSLYLSMNKINMIEEGAFKRQNYLSRLYLDGNPIKRLQNHALFGLLKTDATRIFLYGVPVQSIGGGLFDVPPLKKDKSNKNI